MALVSKYNFSRFAYFDTNILSHLAKNRQLWPKLFDFLKESDLSLGISSAQIAELSDAKNLHQSLTGLFMSVPSAALKTWDVILSEEVKSHPQKRTETLLLYPLNTLLLESNEPKKFEEFFSSISLHKARKGQLWQAQQIAERHTRLKNNFPPSKTGKYIREQADEFAWMQVMQWLAENHRDFLVGFKNNIKDFHPEVFLSIRLYAYVIFYKYYLGQREPKKLSDFGDLFHLFSLPYCEIAVMERDLCNVLNQIKRNHESLTKTVIRDIDFFNDWYTTDKHENR